MLWCDGHNADEKTTKCPRPKWISTKWEQKEAKIRVFVKELKKWNSDKIELTEPQYQLWACMIVTGVHTDKDVPLQTLFISGVTPKCKTKNDNKPDLQDTSVNIQRQLFIKW